MAHFNQRQRRIIALILVNLLLVALVLVGSSETVWPSTAVAVAKSKQMMDANAAAAPQVDVQGAREVALQALSAAGSDQVAQLEFVNATLLSSGESRHWQEAGCDGRNCAHLTYYNHDAGGTLETIVNLETQRVAGSWQSEYARPAGSSWVMPRALQIAAANPQVRSILGDIGEADPAMVPMSAWLADGNCRDEWCVDLTYHDPNGTGRIFHVFVNMERDAVERTFYTRARPDRSAAEPLAQRDAFTDGCHEANDWEVCWEMTADDGIDFQNATYRGTKVFESAKIGQVEAWYPSWPGGYRDEIGFSASVPPLGDTQINELDGGFEIRQFFTEFTRWPNCICCYRYEQVLQLFEDGSMDFRFVSHGPGCDDLSIYRPFWRIDLDLDGPGDDEVYLWEDFTWQEQSAEFETHPVFDDVTADGEKLATLGGDLHYRWIVEETDPLGRDEAYFFLLQYKANEGNGPIVPGPGDTYIPPRQWIDGDALSGENIVMWHVPLLKTIKGGPYWCMPDPEPDFSPCEAVLRGVPGSEFVELTPVELATMQALAVDTPVPQASAEPQPTATPRPIEGSDPEELILNAGCTSCHQIGDLGENHKVGPDLSLIGRIAGERVAGMTAEEYIEQSLLDPNRYLAPECPNGPCMPNIMPRDYGLRLTSDQQNTVVSFLLEQQSLRLPTEEQDNADIQAAPEASPLAKQGTAPRTFDNSDIVAVRVVSILLLSLVFLVSLLVYLRSGPAEDEEPT